MNAPKRIQMSRQRPWRSDNPDAVKVDRSTKYGNPIRITPERIHGRRMFRVHGSPMDRDGGPAYNDPETARYFATQYFRWDLFNGRFGGIYPSLDEIRQDLEGRDLACWCSIRHHRNGLYVWGYCHADILIDAANGYQS